MFADFNDFNELGGIAIKIDHIACFSRGNRTGIHGHADIRLSKGRGVVCAVAAHCNKFPLRLFLSDERQLVFRRCLRKKVVHTCFGSDGCCGHGVVTGNHDSADTHSAQLGKALADAAFDDVLQVHDTEKVAIFSDGKRCAASLGDCVSDRL